MTEPRRNMELMAQLAADAVNEFATRGHLPSAATADGNNAEDWRAAQWMSERNAQDRMPRSADLVFRR